MGCGAWWKSTASNALLKTCHDSNPGHHNDVPDFFAAFPKPIPILKSYIDFLQQDITVIAVQAGNTGLAGSSAPG
jgi:hypothetical protein